MKPVSASNFQTSSEVVLDYQGTGEASGSGKGSSFREKRPKKGENMLWFLSGSMEEENKLMDVDSSDCSNGSAQYSKENSLVATPVDASSSGKGLPYAPEGWPHPGDVWTWKVGRRVTMSGHWLDKSLYPPKNLKNLPSVFHSRSSLAQSIRSEYPEADVDAFFASFIWKIPAAGYIQKETRSGSLEVNGCSKSETATGRGDCKAGNSMCGIRGRARSYALATRSCNICCSETGFCHDCCCILCCKTVDWMYGGYSFVRCEAVVDEKFICGHVAHMDCALRAYLAGKVGGSIDLDAQYYCRCCDNKTDLLTHVTKLIKTCESIDSRDDIEKMLNMCFCILHGSEQDRAKDLQNRVALIMAKLKHGFSLDDIWREEGNISTPAAGNIPLLGNEVTMLGAPEISNDSTASASSMNGIEHSDENDAVDGRAQGNLYISSDHSNVSVKLEDEIDGVLQELKLSQESEYWLAEQKLYAQKDFLLSLYQQLESERSELASPMPLPAGSGVSDNLLTDVLNRVDQIKQEEAKLKEMMKIARGFGESPRTVLNIHFGLPIKD